METWQSGYIDFAHNIFLESLASWGLLVSICCGVFIAIEWVRGAKRADTGARMATVVVLVLLTIQNCVDFSLQLIGVGASWAALFGAMLTWSRDDMRDDKGPRRAAWRRWTPPLVLALLVCVAAGTALRYDRNSLQDEARHQLATGQAQTATRDALALEHPQDFLALELAAALSSAMGEHEVAREVARQATERAPRYPAVLSRRARQAMALESPEIAWSWLERLAESSYDAKRQAMDLVARRSSKDPEFLMGFVARAPEHVVGVSQALSALGSGEASGRLLEWGRKHFPESAHIARYLVRNLLYRPHSEETHKLLDTAAVHYLARSTEEEDPKRAATFQRLGYLSLAHLHTRDGKLLEAWHLFEAAALANEERSLDARFGQARILVLQERYEKLEELLDNLDEEAVASQREEWRVHSLRSRISLERGDTREAIRALQRALLFRPGDANLHARLQALYEHTHQPPKPTSREQRGSSQ
jgi:tetratricopeptide (TPR) repeat protein